MDTGSWGRPPTGEALDADVRAASAPADEDFKAANELGDNRLGSCWAILGR